jgi:predicted transcriptional regulator YdeE
VAVRVPAGEYARVVAEGEVPQAIVNAWRRIWTAEENGDLRRGYRTDFEVWREGSAPEIYLSLAS